MSIFLKACTVVLLVALGCGGLWLTVCGVVVATAAEPMILGLMIGLVGLGLLFASGKKLKSVFTSPRRDEAGLSVPTNAADDHATKRSQADHDPHGKA
jgi:hypothetical protein